MEVTTLKEIRMDNTDNGTLVVSAGEGIFTADKKAVKRDIKNERIRSRVWELDFIRGICVILMVFDHLMYDFMDIFANPWYSATGNEGYKRLAEFATAYWNSDIRGVVRPIVIMCFFVICGISCSFSRNNFKRGIIALVLAFAMTGVTYLIGMPILFGVLHMLAVSILVVALIRLATRNKPYVTALVSIIIGLMFIIGDAILQNVNVTTNNWLCFISNVFTDSKFLSFDYFPMMPNTGAVLIGSALAPLLYRKRVTLLPRLDTQFRWYRPFNFCGRHALIFYVAHQVVWMVLLSLYTLIAIPDGFNLLLSLLGMA